jgi:hypothetical protein
MNEEIYEIDATLLDRSRWNGAGALAFGAASAVATSPKVHKAKIVVTGGHPGDLEYGCGGTIVLILNQRVAWARAEHLDESRQCGGFSRAVRTDQHSQGIEIDGTRIGTKAAKIAERQPRDSHRVGRNPSATILLDKNLTDQAAVGAAICR